ncbi:MAG: hypothetical protein SCK29_03820 [Bacillota bacterium]|nr:hypothetical protein [Bacillota bacterium]MDW7683234.1 hypothetical protein [Bacillota bacterium]
MLKQIFLAIILCILFFSGIGCVQRGDPGIPVEPVNNGIQDKAIIISAELDTSFMTPEQIKLAENVFNNGRPLEDVSLSLTVLAQQDNRWQAQGEVKGMRMTVNLDLQGDYDVLELESDNLIYFGALTDEAGKGMYIYCVPDTEKELVTLTIHQGQDNLLLLTFGKSFTEIEQAIRYQDFYESL